MDPYQDFRHHYLGAAPHSFYIALCWLAAGAIGDLLSPSASIIFFLLASMVNFPVGELLRKNLFKPPPSSTDLGRLKTLFMLMSFAIPLSLPVVYFACRTNINYFYPVFAIIVGAHYLPFFYGYRLKSFLIGGGLIWAAGSLCGLYLPDNFSICAYFTGAIILTMGIMNLRSVKSEITR